MDAEKVGVLSGDDFIDEINEAREYANNSNINSFGNISNNQGNSNINSFGNINNQEPNNNQYNSYDSNTNQQPSYNTNQQQGYSQQNYNNQQQGYSENNYNNINQGYNQQQGYINQQPQYNAHPNMMGNNQNYFNQNMMSNNMNYNQQNMVNNSNMNYGQQNQTVAQSVEIQTVDLEGSLSEYKRRLRADKNVQALTNKLDINNTNSVVNFGQEVSANISKVSDELLNSMKAVKSEEATEMLSALTKLMDKFDVKEIDSMGKEERKSLFNKIFSKAQETIAQLFQKYETMGMEVGKIELILRKYEQDIKMSNNHLKKLYEANVFHYQELERYIVAGELGQEELERYIQQYSSDESISKEEQQLMINKLITMKDMLEQRVYDLQVAENVAIQAAPMIQTIQMSNFNLMRKINSSFIVTLPIFKQCLAQAIILKRQEIQAKSIKQLDDKTNELIMRNAKNTATQSVLIAKMASSSSVQIETLQNSFNTIMQGIEETKAITKENAEKRVENSKRLEDFKHSMKKQI